MIESQSLPVDFEAVVKSSSKGSGGGYPYQISSKDLMKNFVFASIEVDANYIESSVGMHGYPARRLKKPFPDPEIKGSYYLQSVDGAIDWNYDIIASAPTDGIYVLGAISGNVAWIKTEEC